MNRREFILSATSGTAVALAGCLSNPSNGVKELPRPVLGDPDSSVVLKAFEDMACSHCRTYELEIVPSLIEDYIDTNKIRYEYYDFVIPVSSKWSPTLANAARGVQDRLGNEEFWDYKRTIFENQSNLSMDFLISEAESLGVEESDIFNNDIAGRRYSPVINDDKEYGKENYNVQGTPTLVLNDTVLQGQTVANYNILSDAIKESIENNSS